MTSDKVKDDGRETRCSNESVRKINSFDFADNTDEIILTDSEKISDSWKVKRLIKDMLDELSIPTSIVGYNNITEAVYMVYKDKSCINSVTTRIYPEIARNVYRGNSSTVERTIRYAISLACERCSTDTLKEYFGDAVVQNGKIRNKEFIFKLSERLNKTIEQGEIHTNVKMYSKAEAKLLIRAMLTELSIPCSVLGYGNLTEAIALVYTDRSLIGGIATRVYSEIARNLEGSSASKVECSIRHAIKIVWRKCSPEKLREHFGDTTSLQEPISNKEFITKLAERLGYKFVVEVVESESSSTDDDIYIEKSVKKLIRTMITKLAITDEIAGYKYMCEAAYIVYTDRSNLFNFYKDVLYTKIAKAYGVETPHDIVREIKHAITVSEKKSTNCFWKYFEENDIEITIKTVIAKIAENVTEEMEANMS